MLTSRLFVIALAVYCITIALMAAMSLAHADDNAYRIDQLESRIDDLENRLGDGGSANTGYVDPCVYLRVMRAIPRPRVAVVKLLEEACAQQTRRGGFDADVLRGQLERGEVDLSGPELVFDKRRPR